MKKIGVVYRPEFKPAADLAKKVCSWIREKNVEAVVGPRCPAIRGFKKVKDLTQVDFVVALGGDGTYLRGVADIKGESVPVLGVNMGSLGFLTSTRIEAVFTALDKALQNKMKVEKCTLLEAHFRGKKYLALNDFVLERGEWSQLINIEVHAGKSFVSEIKADGVIVSTPTGSTAYNLAAGGPILSPGVNAITLTSVAPHSLTHRPMIFPGGVILRLKLKASDQRAHLIVDGLGCDELRAGDEISISVSDKPHLALRDPSHDYFSVLREKLNFGLRV